MKSLSNTNQEEAVSNVPDIKIHGDPSIWVCLCKSSSEEEGWMKSTKAMAVPGGVLVQVSTQQGDHVAEALAYVPWAILEDGKLKSPPEED